MSCSTAVKIANGTFGGVYIGDTNAVTGDFCEIHVNADAKFHTLTGNITGGIANTTSGSAPTITAGRIIKGAFTAIQLHSGSVIAYRN